MEHGNWLNALAQLNQLDAKGILDLSLRLMVLWISTKKGYWLRVFIEGIDYKEIFSPFVKP